MPNEEEAIQMDFAGLIDVNNGIIEVSVNGSRVQSLVEFGWLYSQAVDGVCVCFSLGRRHGIKVFSDFDVLFCTWLIFARTILVDPLVNDGEICR